MAKQKSTSILAKIREARAQMMIASFSYLAGDSDQKQVSETFNEYANPQRRHLAKLNDEELAELLATESSNSYMHHLAASILRSRESWRTPARWALLLSAFSVIVATIALWRSF